jgi:hypothetical protein
VLTHKIAKKDVMQHIYAHNAGFLMFEIVLGIALFSLMSALYTSLHLSTVILIQYATEYNTAIAIARYMVEQVRAKVRKCGTYVEGIYTVYIQQQEVPLIGAGITIHRFATVRVTVAWNQRASKTMRSVVLIAGLA